ncbi:isocitrate lyase/phosphoenolpyruvate mutase family protein [Actinomadura sp. 9N407]|uniref:isocitrate lyase/phosphoenolpyruvate mutase family protein n=1 Tax=Actinomadura sp. 9N407 TaxID=3375154 RepID=UPI00379A977D
MTFRELHYGARPLLLPNAWDFVSGAALAEAGFAAIGTTSLGVAAAAGKLDGEGGTREETVRLARALVRLPVPVTVDVEDGFSAEPGEVAALAEELASYGVAGINVEDGRADGSLAPVAHQVAVIEAVKARVPDLFVNARTDAYWLPGHSGEGVQRARAFADAGADGIFAPGVAEERDVRAMVEATPLPLNVLFQPGRTDIGRLAELGVRRVSYGSLLFRTALHAAVTTALEQKAPAGVPSYADVQGLVERR